MIVMIRFNLIFIHIFGLIGWIETSNGSKRINKLIVNYITLDFVQDYSLHLNYVQN